MNRCLTEGRRSFYERVSSIEAGSECDRLAPLLSKLADGEASAEDMRTLRPHLRRCLTCYATLRDYRRVPREVALLAGLPAAAIGAAAIEHAADGAGGSAADAHGSAADVDGSSAGIDGSAAGAHGAGDAHGSAFDALGSWAHERAAFVSTKLHSVVEAATAHKAVAIAASTAALAGGSAVTVQSIDDDRARRPAQSEAAPKPRSQPPASKGAAALPAARPAPKSASARRRATGAHHRRGSRPAQPRSRRETAVPDPGGSAPAPSAPARKRAPSGTSTRDSGSSPVEGGEFGP